MDSSFNTSKEVVFPINDLPEKEANIM